MSIGTRAGRAEAPLTEAQEAVVHHDGGPLLVLGSAGTGKTRAMEERYLRLSSLPGLAPHRVLFLCSNRRYSLEAKDRLFAALDCDAVVDVPVYTWHALSHHLVSRYYPALGYREPPLLMTAPEQWGRVRELLEAQQPLDWPVWGPRLHDRAFVDEVADFCLRVTQRLMDPGDLEALAAHRPEWQEVARFYEVYQRSLLRDARLDYAGLIAAAVRMLSGDPELRATLRRRFPQVLVDEGEEMSRAQRELLRLLEPSHLAVAADPDAGIEAFRGAEPDWVHGFEQWFSADGYGQPGVRLQTRRIVLEENHRLGSPAIEAAEGLAGHNDPVAAWRPGVPAAHGTAIEARSYSAPAEEVDQIARELRRLHVFEGVAWEEMAVLISQPAFLLGSLQRALTRWEVPHRTLVGDRPLGAEPAVACFIELANVALRREGWQGLLPAVLTGPLVGLGYTERRQLERAAWQAGQPLVDLVESATGSPALDELRRLRDLVVEYASDAEDCFWQVYHTAPFYQGLREAAAADPDGEADAHLEAVAAFTRSLGRFVERRRGLASIGDYLNEVTRADFGADPWLPPAGGGGPAGQGVAILSFHGAKGREWDTVIVAGCLDAWIPKGRRAQGLFDPLALEIDEPVGREVEAMAGDRRTFYVAATRARRRAIFTASTAGAGRGRPTRFLGELGIEPVVAAGADLPPLTETEQRARLRRLLEQEAPPEEHVAALLALAELPGCDPQRWYGRWGWTEGLVPVEERELKTSYSRLSIYDNCGLQYLLTSVLGLDPSSTHSMKFGTWMHALFEAVHRGDITTPYQALTEYRRLFSDDVFPNLTIARQFRRDGERMLETFWNWERPANAVRVEQWFNIPFLGTQLRGRIDRVDQIGANLKLTDYKTAKWAATLDEAQHSLQLAIYHLAAREDPELRALGKPVAARLVYPGATFSDGKPIERVQNADQADAVLQRLPDLIHGILGEDFSPSPEADCMWCAVKTLCPLWPQGSELDVAQPDLARVRS
ncbi:MAG: ATP-dependent helicase [Actinomycetota bacterium]